MSGGWAFPTRAARAVHWFPDAGQRSGCGRYLFLTGQLIAREHLSLNVAACRACSKVAPR